MTAPMPINDGNQRGQSGARFNLEDWASCDLRPWLEEITNRMHEAARAKTNVVNCSYTHPRGFIPNQILRRAAVRELLRGWLFDSLRRPEVKPPDSWWVPALGLDLNTCDLRPFRNEIEWRTQAAIAEAKTEARLPVIDLTSFHPRGGLHPTILRRIEERDSHSWREGMMTKVARLRGEANRALGLAKSMLEKATEVADPRRLKAAAREQRKLAEELLAEAAVLEKELE